MAGRTRRHGRRPCGPCSRACHAPSPRAGGTARRLVPAARRREVRHRPVPERRASAAHPPPPRPAAAAPWAAPRPTRGPGSPRLTPPRDSRAARRAARATPSPGPPRSAASPARDTAASRGGPRRPGHPPASTTVANPGEGEVPKPRRSGGASLVTRIGDRDTASRPAGRGAGRSGSDRRRARPATRSTTRRARAPRPPADGSRPIAAAPDPGPGPGPGRGGWPRARARPGAARRPGRRGSGQGLDLRPLRARCVRVGARGRRPRSGARGRGPPTSPRRGAPATEDSPSGSRARGAGHAGASPSARPTPPPSTNPRLARGARALVAGGGQRAPCPLPVPRPTLRGAHGHARHGRLDSSPARTEPSERSQSPAAHARGTKGLDDDADILASQLAALPWLDASRVMRPAGWKRRGPVVLLRQDERRPRHHEAPPDGTGDVWTPTLIDSEVILTCRDGDRSAPTAREFVFDVAARLATRVQLTPDGHEVHLGAWAMPSRPAWTTPCRCSSVASRPAPKGARARA